MKPTNASISREGVVPISKTCDAIGPMCRCVQDANTVLQALKVVPSEWRPSRKSLEGVRLGVSRNLTDNYVRFPLSDTKVLFEKAINDLKHIGAEIVEISDMPMASFNEKCAMAIQTSGDFITGIEEYLSTLDGSVFPFRSFVIH